MERVNHIADFLGKDSLSFTQASVGVTERPDMEGLAVPPHDFVSGGEDHSSRSHLYAIDEKPVAMFRWKFG